MDETGDFYNYDFSQTEPQREFTIALPGNYPLKVEDIKVRPLSDTDSRLIADIRRSFLEPENVRKAADGVVGNVFQTLWLHSTKALGFVRAFVEAHGGNWADFGAAVKAGAGRELAEVLQEILSQYIGASGMASVGVEKYTKKDNTTGQKNVIKRDIALKVTQ